MIYLLFCIFVKNLTMSRLNRIIILLFTAVFAVSSAGILTADSTCSACATTYFDRLFAYQAHHCIHDEHDAAVSDCCTADENTACSAETAEQTCSAESDCCGHTASECNCVETNFVVVSPFVLMQQEQPQTNAPVCELQNFRTDKRAVENTISLLRHIPFSSPPEDISIRDCRLLL